MKEELISRMEHDLDLVMDYDEYSYGDHTRIEFEYSKMAKELIERGWTKQIWHEVADGDFPRQKGNYLCYVHIIGWDRHNELIDGYGYSVEFFDTVFCTLNKSVIAWTEFAAYEK